MAKTMQRKLLEHLANVIEIDYVDLLQYFKEYHPATQTEDYLDTVRETLITLIEKNNYVQLKETIPIIEIGKIRNNNNVDVVLTLDRAIELWGDKLKGKITNEGRHYLADIVRNEKQDSLNDAVKKTNNLQVILACVIAAATIAQVWVAYNPNKISGEAPKEQIKEQIETVKRLEERLSNKEKSDSVLFRQIKDSLKKHFGKDKISQ